MIVVPQQKKRCRIAVMQPYFFPYAGYFRLLADVEYFIILDTVQFNRRGRVHRVEVPAPKSGVEWLTLPLAHLPRDTRIQDLAFATGARNTLDERLKRYPWLQKARGPAAERVLAMLYSPLHSVIDFLAASIELVADVLAMRTNIVRASQIPIEPDLRGQDRIIAIVQAMQGTEYINAPGGRHLYTASAFRQAELHLSFLPPYDGEFPFLLPALLHEDPERIRADIFKALH